MIFRLFTLNICSCKKIPAIHPIFGRTCVVHPFFWENMFWITDSWKRRFSLQIRRKYFFLWGWRNLWRIRGLNKFESLLNKTSVHDCYTYDVYITLNCVEFSIEFQVCTFWWIYSVISQQMNELIGQKYRVRSSAKVLRRILFIQWMILFKNRNRLHIQWLCTKAADAIFNTYKSLFISFTCLFKQYFIRHKHYFVRLFTLF